MSVAEIICVYDEGAKEGTSLIGAMGFSLSVNVDGKKILFDTGRRGRYLKHNLRYLKLDANDFDAVVISHSSKDHIGGLDGLLDTLTKKIDVYANDSTWNMKKMFSPLIKDENISKIEKKQLGDWIQLSDNLFITPQTESEHPECSLVITTKKGVVAIIACGHDGIDEILSKISSKFGKIMAVVGGVHLKKAKQDDADALADIFKKYDNPELHLNGCTSPEGIQKLRVAICNDAVSDFFVGDILKY